HVSRPRCYPSCRTSPSGIGAQVLRKRCPDASGISAQVAPEQVPKWLRNTQISGTSATRAWVRLEKRQHKHSRRPQPACDVGAEKSALPGCASESYRPSAARLRGVACNVREPGSGGPYRGNAWDSSTARWARSPALLFARTRPPRRMRVAPNVVVPFFRTTSLAG
ncbi:MAG: hypothetical protein JWN04_3432, partial [Myxococcaceae bacterium]|nr:hypothetical protein [Myxococcaceae bacterium]